MRFAVTVWNHRSESPYTFGPFASEVAAERWIARLPAHIQANEVVVLNGPTLVGTGMESG